MIAGKPVNFGAFTKVYSTSKKSPLSLPTGKVTGKATRQATQSASFQKSASIFSNILKGGELPETFRESVTTTNLLNLGQASKDISSALNQVAGGLQNQITSLTKSTTGKIIEEQTPIQDGIITKSTKSQFSDIQKKIEPYVPYVILGGLVLVGIRLIRK